MKKGQITLEYIFVVSIILTLLLLFMFFAWHYADTGKNNVKIRSSFNKLDSSIKRIGASEVGDFETVNIWIPENIKDVIIEKQSITYVDNNGGDHFLLTKYNLTGIINNRGDITRLKVVKINDNTVLLDDSDNYSLCREMVPVTNFETDSPEKVAYHNITDKTTFYISVPIKCRAYSADMWVNSRWIIRE